MAACKQCGKKATLAQIGGVCLECEEKSMHEFWTSDNPEHMYPMDHRFNHPDEAAAHYAQQEKLEPGQRVYVGWDMQVDQLRLNFDDLWWVWENQTEDDWSEPGYNLVRDSEKELKQWFTSDRIQTIVQNLVAEANAIAGLGKTGPLMSTREYEVGGIMVGGALTIKFLNGDNWDGKKRDSSLGEITRAAEEIGQASRHDNGQDVGGSD